MPVAKMRPPEELRRKGFRIGEVHGKLLPGGDPREYGIQRAMYLIGTVRLRYVKGRHTDVRLIGYETPLCKARRGESVDLVVWVPLIPATSFPEITATCGRDFR
jgi:hypothetical protein